MKATTKIFILITDLGLWHHTSWSRLAHLLACYAAGAILLFFRTHRVQLLRHHAAGHVRDVVLCGEHHVAVGTFHPYAIHAYLTTYINPMHYFIDAIRTVFIRGGGLHETAHQVLALAGIGTLMGCWAVQSYKKNS